MLSVFCSTNIIFINCLIAMSISMLFHVIMNLFDVSVVKCNTLVILEELPFLASTSATFHFLICLEDISSTTVAHSKWFRYFRRFLWVDLLYLLKPSIHALNLCRFRLSSKEVLTIS